MWAFLLFLGKVACDDEALHSRYRLLAEVLAQLPQDFKDELHAQHEARTQMLRLAELEEDHIRGTKKSRFTQREAVLIQGRMEPENLESSFEPYNVANLIRVLSPELVDRAEIISLKIVNSVSGKEQLFLCIDGGEILLFSLNRNSNGLGTDSANQILPPEMILGRASCGGDVDSFCRVADVEAVHDGALVIDRHRIMHMQFNWLSSGEPQTVSSDANRRFGRLNQRITGNDGLFYPSAIVLYTPWNTTHISADVPWSEVMVHGLDHFVFVSDSGNHRIIVVKNDDDGFSYVTQFGTGVPDSGPDGLDTPLGLAILNPAWEFKYEPIYANIFVADSYNHRIVKLDFGYPLSYNHSYGDEVGKINETYYWNFWEYQPDRRPTDEIIYLEYSGSFGDETPGDPKDGRLVKPVGVCTYRHFIFVVEERPEYTNSQRIVVLRINPANTTTFIYVTELYPERGIVLTGSISVGKPPNGALWYSYSKDLVHMYAGVADIPVQLRKDPTPSPYVDWLQQCVNRSFYNTLVHYEEGRRIDWQKVMTENLLRAGLNYWPYFAESSTEHGPDEARHNLTNPMDEWNVDAFNGTLHNLSTPVDFELFEQILFAGGSITFCEKEQTVSLDNVTKAPLNKKLDSPLFGAARPFSIVFVGIILSF